MEPTDITVQILREIRDGVNETNDRLGQTNARLDQTNGRLDLTREEMNARFGKVDARFGQLERRLTETENRLTTELVAVAAAVREVRDELREDRRLRARVDDHERRIGVLEKGREEAH
jgi:chromosome segregation ATPase